MKRIAFWMLAAGAGLFAVGCGRGSDHREVKHDVQQLVHDAQTDANHAADSAARTANAAAHDAESAVHELQADVHRSAVELRSDVHSGDNRYGTEVIQVRGDADPRLANPTQLERDAKANAVQAAGAAAEAEAEKLLKLK
jgi:hypothetical protein